MKRYGTLPQSDLVTYLQVEPAAISKTLSKLEKKGVIERKFLRDKREKYITLTEQGNALYHSLKEPVLLHRELALKGLTEKERIQLFTILKEIHQNME